MQGGEVEVELAKLGFHLGLHEPCELRIEKMVKRDGLGEFTPGPIASPADLGRRW